MLFQLSKNKFKERRESGTLERFQKVLKRVSYKPNFSAIAFDTGFNIFNDLPPICEMRIHVVTKCSRQGGVIEIVHSNQLGFDQIERWKDADLILWIQNCFRKAEMHEFDEFFKVDGLVFDDPHKSDL